jgi:hypothetical protein
MAITTYDELVTAGANWSNRSDLTSRWPEFISLVDADLNTELNVRDIETDQTLSLVASSRTVALPTGFREALNLWPVWTSGRGEPLRRVTPDLLITSTVTGCPSVWCVDGTNIAFDCPADQAYTFTLRMRAGSALTSDNPTNDILTSYPNVYLFGMLREAYSYLDDAENEARYATKYADALAKAKQKEGRDKGRVTLSTEPGALTAYGRRDGFNVYRGY